MPWIHLPALSDQPPAWAARVPRGGTPWLALPPPTEGRFAHLAWPKALKLADGTVLVACLAACWHGAHGGGSPAVALSTDGGATFLKLDILREFGPDKDYSHSGNLALGVAADGAIVLLAMAYTGDEQHHIFGWRSPDGGQTWTPADTATLGPNRTGSVFGNILAQPDGTLLALGHYRAGARSYTHGVWQARSTDHGLSWGAPERLSDGHFVEPMLIRAGDRLIAFLRGSQPGAKRGDQSLAVSDDDGRTWSGTPPLLAPSDPATCRLAAPFAMVDPDDSDRLLALTTERHVDGSTPGAIWLWHGSARTLTFERQTVVLEFPRIEGDPNTDFGYPWLIRAGSRRWRMFYYHGKVRGANAIWGCDLDIQ